MEPSDLALYTSQELIDELMRRTTFLGVVVHSEQDLKGRDWVGERIFKVNFNANLDATQAGRLLDVVADYMDRQDC